MVFLQLAAQTQELMRRWGHLPPALHRTEDVPVDAVHAALKRVQSGRPEPIDAEILVRSLAAVSKAGQGSEAAVERLLRNTTVDGDLWLRGLTDPALPAQRRPMWTGIALTQGTLAAAEVSLIQWFSLPITKRGTPDSFMVHVPPLRWGEWLRERGLTTRLEVPLVQELVLHGQELQPHKFGAEMLHHWMESRLLGPVLRRGDINETRKIGGRLLALGHAILKGQQAMAFRNQVRRLWAELDPVHRGSARGFSAQFLGLTEAQAAWLNRQESNAEFMAFMEMARTEAHWAGERANFWQQRYPMVQQLGYDCERSATGDRLIFTLKDKRFAVEFLDAGPLSFYGHSQYTDKFHDDAVSAMRSTAFRENYKDWAIRIAHRGYWYDKAMDELTRFAGGPK